MKIGPSTAGMQAETATAAAGNAAQTPAMRAADGRPTGIATDGAKLELSSTATTMLAGSAGSSADFDAAKVDRISRAIADGSFKVDPGAIADRLISNAEELLRGNRPGA